MFAGLAVLIVANNTISVRSVTSEQFMAQLDQATERGTARVTAYAQPMLRERNPALFHMVADMATFAPDPHHWGSLTHQLFAVYLYRKYQGTSPSLETLVDHLSERIASEAVWDVRVTDLYLQRAAFLLAAGKPDLVKRRRLSDSPRRTSRASPGELKVRGEFVR